VIAVAQRAWLNGTGVFANAALIVNFVPARSVQVCCVLALAGVGCGSESGDGSDALGHTSLTANDTNSESAGEGNFWGTG
jgi:hypothetical protein